MKKTEYIKDNAVLFRKYFNNGWIQPKKLRRIIFLILFLIGNMTFMSNSYSMHRNQDEVESHGMQARIDIHASYRRKNFLWTNIQEPTWQERQDKAIISFKNFDELCIKKAVDLDKCDSNLKSCKNDYSKLEKSNALKINTNEQLQQCEGKNNKISLLNDECSKKVAKLSLLEKECSEKLVGSNNLNTDFSQQLEECKSKNHNCSIICEDQLQRCMHENNYTSYLNSIANEELRLSNEELKQCKNVLSSLRTTCNTTFLEERNNDFNLQLHQCYTEKTELFYDNYLLINQIEKCEYEKNHTSLLNSFYVEKLENSKNNILSSFKNENISSMCKGAVSSVLPEIIRDAVGYTSFSHHTEQIVTVARGCILAGMTYCNADSFLPAVGAAVTGIVIRRVSDELSKHLALTAQQKMALNIVTNFGPSVLFNPNFVFDYMYYIVGSGLSLEAYTQIKSFISAQNQANGVELETSSLRANGKNAPNVALESSPLHTEEQPSPGKKTDSLHKTIEHQNNTNNNYFNDVKSTTSVQFTLSHAKDNANEAEKVSTSNPRSDGSSPTVKNSSQPSLVNSFPKIKDEHKPQVTRQSSEDFSSRYNREGLGIAIKKVNSANEK